MWVFTLKIKKKS